MKWKEAEHKGRRVGDVPCPDLAKSPRQELSSKSKKLKGCGGQPRHTRGCAEQSQGSRALAANTRREVAPP